jgi:monofunctional biosynthetic peptidoglycan transglycosylase
LSSKRKRSLPRRILRACLLALLAWVALGVVAVALLPFVPPVASSVMLQDWIGARVAGDDAFVLRYRWTPWKDVAPVLPISLVAAEDQKFPFHRGFDIDAIRDALADADEGARLRGATDMPICVSVSVLAAVRAFAIPKSITIASPSLIMMFSGLMSR